MRVALQASVSIRRIHLKDIFCNLRSSCRIVCTDPTEMATLEAMCSTLTQRSSKTTFSLCSIMCGVSVPNALVGSVLPAPSTQVGAGGPRQLGRIMERVSSRLNRRREGGREGREGGKGGEGRGGREGSTQLRCVLQHQVRGNTALRRQSQHRGNEGLNEGARTNEGNRRGQGKQEGTRETGGDKGSIRTSVSQSGPYRPPGGVEEMQGGGRRVRLEWGTYITV
ncbi:hypothetical protein FHG87_021073 [Trinorchestia longiramus]|nr:hypothetical protein FHG87_021073 [Trinorchestia longiramus]